MSLFSKNGLKRALLDPLGRGRFFRSDCSSAAKAPWTTLMQYIRAAVSSVVVNSPADFSLQWAFFRKRIEAVVRTTVRVGDLGQF
jgi:hypothetical protein